MVAIADRRRRERLALRCPVRLSRSLSGVLMEVEVRNLSSDGLYCVAATPLDARETIRGSLRLPAGGRPSVLRFRARVVRVESRTEGGFGIGLAFDDYELTTEGD